MRGPPPVLSSSVHALETSPPLRPTPADASRAAILEGDPSIGATPDPWQQASEPDPSDCQTDAPHPLETQSGPQRAAHRTHHKERWAVVNALWQPDVAPALRKRACRMGRCCQMPTLRLRADGTIAPALTRCRDRLCPLCAEKRGRVAAARTAALVEKFNSPRFMTLTLKHRGEPLSEMATRAAAAFNKLRESSTWKRHVKGGIWAAEVTLNVPASEWHYHVHVIADGTYFPQPQLKALWSEITGDSFIVDIRPVHDRRSAARYIARYVAKPVDVETWPEWAIRQYAKAMHGRRLLQPFGTAHNPRLDADDQPEPPNPTTHLLHSHQLTTACVMGIGAARTARMIIARMGREHAMAVGVSPECIRSTKPPEPWEHRYALEVCAALHRLPRHEWAPFNLPAADRDGDGPEPDFPFDRDDTVPPWPDTAAGTGTSATLEPTTASPS